MQAQHIKFLKLLDGDVQYVVPRWQRRYCWRQSDIERLVEDLLAIAEADQDSTHYAGTLLTYPEPGAAGVLSTIRVVDGQQRLTTVSILLACIAGKLDRDGPCGEWTSEIIRERRLSNPHMPPEKHFKLRLQTRDDEEYRLGFADSLSGSGAVTQAWRIARRLVERSDTARFLMGLERLRVVSIGLSPTDDPQQIFESLNATGRPLTESEKVKNWLLIGLPEDEQRELHDRYWRQIERSLHAEHTSEPIDMFLRDVMRWYTGQVQGRDKTYEQLRRWALKQGHAKDRSRLCQHLTRLAELYGILAGWAGSHSDRKVERELGHLRALGLDVHRPFTLRLLYEAKSSEPPQISDGDLARSIAIIGTWITRLWLAGKPMAGMNKAMAELAFGAGPDGKKDYATYWLDRIRRFRSQRIGVPSDAEVKEGIRTRKAYGGGTTQQGFSVLCELMEAEHRDESPARSQLAIEHIMPQNLTEEWKKYLGKDAENIHTKNRHSLANLTLSGDVRNAKMGTDLFVAKKKAYGESTIGMTQRLADENEWDKAAISRRADDLARQALGRWPWQDPGQTAQSDRNSVAAFRWRIEGGQWQTEHKGSQMVCNVAGALLTLSPENIDRLRGGAISTNIHSASLYAPGTKVGARVLRAIPGHDDWVISPYQRNYPAYADRCRKLGKRCSVNVEVEPLSDGPNTTEDFWRYFKERTGGVPGQTEDWRGGNQWTQPFNALGDCIGIGVGNSDVVWLYIRSSRSPTRSDIRRMQRFSRMICDEMADLDLAGDLQKESEQGKTIRVERRWVRDDENEWGEVCQWIQDQCERMRVILAVSDTH